MTYCVGLKLKRGIVFASDTRTNAGVDNIATFTKMNVWEVAGDRVIVVLSAGNLAVTQAVVSLLNENMASDTGEQPTLKSASTMFQAARSLGAALREVHRIDGEQLGANAESFSASFILGGQISGDEPRLFQIYNEGNFIEATPDTPFFQIGEHKYGKPILDRVTEPGMRMGQAAKLVLLSFDSTLRSNLSVGMPIDLLLYRTDSLKVTERRRLEQDDAYFRTLSAAWSEALRDAFTRIEEFDDPEVS
jgi:putative proteasome-type protease